MSKSSVTSPPRLFTAASANRTLPLVSAILTDLSPLWCEVHSAQKRVQHLIENRRIEKGNPYSDELTAVHQSLAAKSQRVECLIDELRQLGVEFRGTDHPHVCFPSMLEGRLVYLSWQLGEPEVCHWVDLDEDFAERRSLLTEVSRAD